MRTFTTLALVAPAACLLVVAACSGKGGGVLTGDDGSNNNNDDASASSGDNSSSGSSSSGGGVFNGGDGGNAQGATDCKGGHYTGTFTGSYTSYLTNFFGLGGLPLMVTGDVEMDLQEMVTMTNGEVPTITFNIANGTISGLANGLFPYHCDMVGTLDCNTKKLIDGGIKNCTYCVGLFTQTDAGVCLATGHFAGPLTSDYDGKTFSFVNGTWNGSEALGLDDAGLTSLPEGGGVNDAGLYVGPGNFGGSGNWTAMYVGDN
jgi:hypothetical protein